MFPRSLKQGSCSLVPYDIFPLFPCSPKPLGDPQCKEHVFQIVSRIAEFPRSAVKEKKAFMTQVAIPKAIAWLKFSSGSNWIKWESFISVLFKGRERSISIRLFWPFLSKVPREVTSALVVFFLWFDGNEKQIELYIIIFTEVDWLFNYFRTNYDFIIFICYLNYKPWLNVKENISRAKQLFHGCANFAISSTVQ